MRRREFLKTSGRIAVGAAAAASALAAPAVASIPSPSERLRPNRI